MNLLTDKWIPVTFNGQFKHITLENILCQDADWQLRFHRDDMALATLQLIVCLTQVIFMPNNAQELRQRLKKPLTFKEYKTCIQQYLDMFVLNHPQHPFMQTAELKGKSVSPQKLFIGLPEQASTSPNAHAFFNQTIEIEKTCLPCTTVALFQQATNGLSLGGVAFSVGLKGSSPITTLLTAKNNLRETIWLNILNKEFIQDKTHILLSGKENLPTWLEPIAISKEKVTVHTHEIGLLRGLFWQPARIKLNIHSVNDEYCDSCGTVTNTICTEFTQEPYTYKRGEGTWIHPHSPRIKTDKGIQYLKFSSKKPIWEQLTAFFWEIEQKIKTGNNSFTPALVVSQSKQVFSGKISIVAGGYILGNSTEKIEGRRHELFQLEQGWENGFEDMNEILQFVIEIPDKLKTSIWYFVKNACDDGLGKELQKKLPTQVRDEFYRRSETKIYVELQDVDWDKIENLQHRLFKYLSKLAFDLYKEVTQPYEHNPAIYGAIVVGHENLCKALNKLNPEKSNETAE